MDAHQTLQPGYTFQHDALLLGCALHNGQPVPGVQIKAPLRMFNRHGLIAGATGTGKTKTLQLLAEQLSARSVPVLLMDIKGDLSGIAAPGTDSPKIQERHAHIGTPWQAQAFPVEFLSLTDAPGTRLRATVTEFGPTLMSKVLGLNDTQQGVLALVFKYCDDHSLALLDLKDLKKALQYLTNEGKEEIQREYGAISTTSTGTILRKIIELEQQGAEAFFGERSFEVNDLLRIDDQGRGIVSILRLTDLQDKPKLFSTFMLSLLAEIYATFPEEGDLEAPKLVLFIDEAHLVFEEATDALLNQLETVIKLIRSKGVGVFFCTQNPADIPDDVLAQLGLKVQHALRAFTAKDQKAIRLVADNFPPTNLYDVSATLLAMGVGEAFVTVLNEKGIPTPLAHTLVAAPSSRMGILSPDELQAQITQSRLVAKYAAVEDRESAYEILDAKLQAFEDEAQQAELRKQQQKAEAERAKAQREADREAARRQRDADRQARSERTWVDDAAKTIGRTATNTVARELTRGLLGVLGIGGRSGGGVRRRNSLW
jgi:hypothetical protein